MQSRRSFVATGVSALCVGTAGCLDAIPFIGDEPMEFGAGFASVPESVRDETGYEENAEREVEIEETFEAAGQSQDVIVTNGQTEYEKSVDLGALGVPIDERQRAAIFTVLTTPQVSVLGRTFNPVGDMSSEDLAGMVQDRYEGLGSLEQVGEDTATVVGESTNVGEFEGEADLSGEGVTVDLTLHVAEAIESGDDLVLGVGGYPTQLDDAERQNIFAMMEGIEHDG